MSVAFISVTLDSKLIEKKKFDRYSVSIGRDVENDITINNLAVSRFHAKIEKEDDRYILKDLGSSNGTFVNGNRIDSAEIIPGDSVLIGKHILTLETSKIHHNDEAFTEGHTVMVDSSTQDKFLKQMEDQPLEVESSSQPQVQYQPPSRGSRIILPGGVETPLNSEFFSIGSDPSCDVKVNGLFIKAKHASIIKHGDNQFRIINSGSFLKPTKVNGTKIDQKILQNGDVIQIGNAKMIFIS